MLGRKDSCHLLLGPPLTVPNLLLLFTPTGFFTVTGSFAIARDAIGGLSFLITSLFVSVSAARLKRRVIIPNSSVSARSAAKDSFI